MVFVTTFPQLLLPSLPCLAQALESVKSLLCSAPILAAPQMQSQPWAGIGSRQMLGAPSSVGGAENGGRK